MLLERSTELEHVETALARAARGDGCALLLEGAGGIGKTSLLSAAASSAQRLGMQVCWARGDELESGFPWGMVLQLFREEATAVARQLTGPARLVRTILAPEDARADPAEDPFPLMHALHSLTVDLADRAPRVLLLDDAHWSDLQSLRFACYLLRRLAGLRVAVLIATRPVESASTEITGLLAKIRAETSTNGFTLQRLTDDSIRTLVRKGLPQATDAFGDAVAKAVAGNPLLCRELIAAIRADGVETTDRAATLVRKVQPAGVRNSILVRLGQLGHEAASLATATAVLGPGATLDRVRRLADVDAEATDAAIDALVANGILDFGTRLEFAHPIVREVVHADLGPASRSRQHLRAARLLHGDEAPATEVASHLLVAGPCREEWAVTTLRNAAAAARAQGAPERAATLLRATLDVEGSPRGRAETLLLLGGVEASIGTSSALDRYMEALDLLPGAADDPGIAVELGQVLYASGRFDDALVAFERGMDGWETLAAEQRDAVVEARLVSGIAMAASLSASSSQRIHDRLAALVEHAPRFPGPADRVLLALAAGRHAMGIGVPDTERCRERVLALALGAAAGGGLAADVGTVVLEPLALALGLCDEFDAACSVLDAALSRASDEGELATHATLLPIRGFVRAWRGDLAGAADDATEALQVAQEVRSASQQTTAPARWVLAVASLEQGQADTAIRALDVADPAQRWEGSPLYGWYLDAVGRVALARGDAEGALSAFREAGHHFGSAGGPAAYCDWRSGAALALHTAGSTREAVDLVDEELRLARAFGAPRPIAIALRRRAWLCDDEADATPLLREALDVLGGSPARLERARVEVALGVALRRSGRRRDCRPHLRAGLDLARRCGAQPLADRATEELAASGARRPDLPVSGVAALTPSELRVVRRAVDGSTNREIAEALFVTPKTVEVHLTSSYRKLGIRSRTELADALAPLEGTAP